MMPIESIAVNNIAPTDATRRIRVAVIALFNLLLSAVMRSTSLRFCSAMRFVSII